MSLFPEIAARPRTLAGNLSGGQRQMLAFACPARQSGSAAAGRAFRRAVAEDRGRDHVGAIARALVSRLPSWSSRMFSPP